VLGFPLFFVSFPWNYFSALTVGKIGLW